MRMETCNSRADAKICKKSIVELRFISGVIFEISLVRIEKCGFVYPPPGLLCGAALPCFLSGIYGNYVVMISE